MPKVEIYNVVATVTGIKEGTKCPVNHKVGDTFEISVTETGSLCGWLYHDLFPHLLIFQHGRNLWWKGDTIEEYRCPDHRVTKIKLERFKKE